MRYERRVDLRIDCPGGILLGTVANPIDEQTTKISREDVVDTDQCSSAQMVQLLYPFVIRCCFDDTMIGRYRKIGQDCDYMT